MINEKQIHYLLTVAEERNITAAARKLYISQPALSRLILDLEQHIGTPLFIRNRGSLIPTQAGEVYLRGCREVLSISRSVSKKISDLRNNNSGRIILGITPLTGEFLLSFIMDAFEDAFPHIELVLIEEKMMILQEMIKTGKADIAFVYQGNDSELQYHLFLKNPVYLQVPEFFLVGRNNWKPGRHNPSIRPESLSGQPMILLKKGHGMREAADHFLMQYQIAPGKIVETESIHVASRLVSLGKGFTFVPSIATYNFSGYDNYQFYCQIQGYMPKRDLYCCYRNDEYLSEAERFLIYRMPEIMIERGYGA